MGSAGFALGIMSILEPRQVHPDVPTDVAHLFGLALSDKAPALTVVVPCFNEEHRLAEPLEHIAGWLHEQSFDSELLVIDDGSRDRTTDIARRVAERSPLPVAVARYHDNRGKGFALKIGFELARGERILFCDADLATPIEEASSVVAALDRGADVVIGSRKMRGANIVTHQPLYREVLGKIFTWIVRRTIADVSDVTCGFKAFRRDAGKELFRQVRIYDWSFDAEILLLAYRQGLKVTELPVRWEDKPGTKVRLLRDAPRSIANLLRIRRNVSTGVYASGNPVHPPLECFVNDPWISTTESDTRSAATHAVG